MTCQTLICTNSLNKSLVSVVTQLFFFFFLAGFPKVALGQTAGAGNLFEECLVSVVAAAVVAAIPIVADDLLSFVVVPAIAGSFVSFVVAALLLLMLLLLLFFLVRLGSWFMFSFLHSVGKSSSSLWSLSSARHYSAVVRPVVLYRFLPLLCGRFGGILCVHYGTSHGVSLVMGHHECRNQALCTDKTQL